jgi:hypothetical protein
MDVLQIGFVSLLRTAYYSWNPRRYWLPKKTGTRETVSDRLFATHPYGEVPLAHYLRQIAIAEGVAQIPANTEHDDLIRKCRPRNSDARVQTIELHANRSSAAICNTAVFGDFGLAGQLGVDYARPRRFGNASNAGWIWLEPGGRVVRRVSPERATIC